MSQISMILRRTEVAVTLSILGPVNMEGGWPGYQGHSLSRGKT